MLLTLLATGGWLVARIFIGLDFTDEMQYYGEIAGLVQTSRFFEYDLFLQQLGYIFVFPFFKLHALLFPDQGHLVLFGRTLLAAAYAIVAVIFWRSATHNGFSLVPKLAGLSAFLAWIPFQLFAFSYNSMAYLLVVAAMATWLTMSPIRFRGPAVRLAALLAALVFIYPPAGVAVILLTTAAIAQKFGRRAGGQFLGLAAGFSAAVLAAIVALHGLEFFHDLSVAIGFTRSFSVAQQFLKGDQPVALGITLIAITAFIWNRRRPGRPQRAGKAATAMPRRDLATIAAILIGIALWFPQAQAGYAATAALLLLLMLAARGPAGISPGASAGTRRADRAVAISILFAGAAIVANSITWAPSGYFATTIFMLLLAMAVGTESGQQTAVRDLAVAGMVLGGVSAAASSNGLHNFGLGGAAVIPFLALHGSRGIASTPPSGSSAGRTAITAGLVSALLFNGALCPSLEKRGLTGLGQIAGVPAFTGISVSAIQRQALQTFRSLLPEGGLAGKRILVAGPHPWLYFVTRAQPATPMFFMHFTGPAQTYELLATRLFRAGAPDAVLVTNAVPAPIQARLLAWANDGCVAQKVAIPAPVREAYHRQTNYELSPAVLLLTRQLRVP